VDRVVTTCARIAHRCLGAALLGIVPSAGCSDQVVGYFAGAGSATTDAESSSGALGSDGSGSDGSGSGVLDPSTTTGEPAFVPPGCFTDDFEDGDPNVGPWNAWADPGTAIQEIDGMLKFDAAPMAINGTGVVGDHLHLFPFRNGTVRTRVVAAPETNRPVGLYLQVLNDSRVESISLGGGQVTVDLSLDGTTLTTQSFPYDPYPQWIGLRGAEQVVHFEVSMDGNEWTTIASLDRPVILEGAGALIMTLTYGNDPGGVPTAVDDFEACVE
jgi:hypothetical protein